MQAYTAGIVKPKATEILAPPPRSGSFSVYAQKLTALVFVWLCAIVVWGNNANVAGVANKCSVLCIIQIVCAVLVWVYVTVLLILNFLTENGKTLSRTSFSHAVEAQFTVVLIFLWLPVVFVASSLNAAAPVAIWFAWFGFFGSIYATYKAYHCFKEEDLPSDLPEGYDEENYVYG